MFYHCTSNFREKNQKDVWNSVVKFCEFSHDSPWSAESVLSSGVIGRASGRLHSAPPNWTEKIFRFSNAMLNGALRWVYNVLEGKSVQIDIYNLFFLEDDFWNYREIILWNIQKIVYKLYNIIVYNVLEETRFLSIF